MAVSYGNFNSVAGALTEIGRQKVNDLCIVRNGLVLNIDAGDTRSYSGSGNTCTDLSSNMFTGTLNNGVTYSTDNGGSFIFDGVNDYISIPSNTALNPTLDMTVSCWAYLTGFKTALSLFGKGAGVSGQGGYDFRVDSATQLNLVKYYIIDQTVTVPTISLNTWYNFAAVQGSTSVAYYINGVYANTFSNSVAYQTPIADMAIGKSRLTVYAGGKINNVLKYNRQLTAAEIQQNFNATRWRFGI